MKARFLWMIAGLTSSAVIFTPAALAADGNFYIGGGVGYSKVKIDDNIFPVTGATASSLTKDDSDVGFKIFGGYQFNPNIGVEVGYVDLGQFTATRNVTAPAVGTIGGTIKASGVFADLVGTMPLQNSFSLLGKVGVMYSETKASAGTSGAVVVPAGTNLNPKENETNFKFGLGAQYDFNKSVGVRAEWERYFKLGKSNTTGEGDVDLFSLNMIVKF